MRCAVVGAGAWGTALASLLSSNGHETSIWALEPDVVRSINELHENSRFLKGFALASSLCAANDLARVVEGAALVVYATPSHHLRRIAAETKPRLTGNATVVIATKGIEQGRLALMSEVAAVELPGCPVVALSGPSFAAEVAAGQPTAIVAASADERAAIAVQSAFSSSRFRVYTHDDVIGVELGGALKNVMAVATGMVEGAGLGFNSRAALITRGLHEMTRLGVALGAHSATFAGLAGLGDLVLTCTGALSRNRALGIEIGQGATLDEALAGKETVAEGVLTTASARELARVHDVSMPIADTVFRILFEGQAARDAVPELMARELRSEQDL